MKKSKILALTLGGLMAANILAGCSGSSNDNNAASTPSTSSSTKESASEADTYPKQSIQLVVPVKPGGDTDLNARLFAKYMEKELGQTLIIINVDGAGGTIGMDEVKNAKPDGYTALFFHTEAMIPTLAGMIEDKFTETFDMAGIAIVDDTTVLATHKDAPYKTLNEFIDYAKANPGKAEFGMLVGGYPHLVGLGLEQQAGIDLNLVDIGGNAAKTTALLGHKTDVINTQYGLTKDYFANGEFINLGLLADERNELFPDVPTAKEQGLDLKFGKFFFSALPKGTPTDIIEKYSAAMKKVVENPEFIEELKKSYLTPVYMNPAEAKAYADGVYDSFVQYQDLFREGSTK